VPNIKEFGCEMPPPEMVKVATPFNILPSALGEKKTSSGLYNGVMIKISGGRSKTVRAGPNNEYKLE